MQDFTPRIEEYLTKLKNTIDRLDRTEINNFINLLLKARDEDRTIFIMGNGGSAATPPLRIIAAISIKERLTAATKDSNSSA